MLLLLLMVLQPQLKVDAVTGTACCCCWCWCWWWWWWCWCWCCWWWCCCWCCCCCCCCCCKNLPLQVAVASTAAVAVAASGEEVPELVSCVSHCSLKHCNRSHTLELRNSAISSSVSFIEAMPAMYCFRAGSWKLFRNPLGAPSSLWGLGGTDAFRRHTCR